MKVSTLVAERLDGTLVTILSEKALGETKALFKKALSTQGEIVIGKKLEAIKSLHLLHSHGAKSHTFRKAKELVSSK